MVTLIQVEEIAQSDGSKSYDLVIRQGENSVRLGCIDQAQANRFAAGLAEDIESFTIETAIVK